MSLYDESEAGIKKPKPRNPGINFLESHLRTKKPPPSKQPRITLAPVIDLHGRNRKNQISATRPWVIKDEYDPLHPNDFYKIRTDVQQWREKEQQRQAQEQAVTAAIEIEMKKAQEQVVREKQARSAKNFLSNYGYDSDDCSGDEKETVVQFMPNGRIGAQFAPPPCLIEPSSRTSPIRNTSIRTGEAAAAKIMAKYGFKEGQGLGKDQQGISTALQVQRTSRNCGRIIHDKQLMPPPIIPKPTESQDLIQPSSVVLLGNMVDSGEVDDELESEIKDECLKYGQVNRVLICDRGSGEVRVFVEFNTVDEAVKAVLDLNGRYFGGRTIKAQFYNVEHYKAFQLSD